MGGASKLTIDNVMRDAHLTQGPIVAKTLDLNSFMEIDTSGPTAAHPGAAGTNALGIEARTGTSGFWTCLAWNGTADDSKRLAGTFRLTEQFSTNSPVCKLIVAVNKEGAGTDNADLVFTVGLSVVDASENETVLVEYEAVLPAKNGAMIEHEIDLIAQAGALADDVFLPGNTVCIAIYPHEAVGTNLNMKVRSDARLLIREHVRADLD